MEVQPFEQLWELSEGFFPDQPALRGIPNTVIDGENAWLNGSLWVSDRGPSSLGASGTVSDLQLVGDQHGGVRGVGNIWRAFATTWFTGEAYVNGLLIGNSPGALSLLVGGTPTTAGLSVPGTPGLAASATAGRVNGAVSVVVQAFRQTSGARSSRSAGSATVTVQNKKVIVTFPVGAGIPTGTTHWIIGGSIRGVPGGPWYRLTNVAIVPVGTLTAEIDFVNGDLGALMAINYDVPPACTHCAGLGGVMLALGTGTGGYGVRPSIVGQPEAFPLEYGFDLPVRAAITGVQPGIDGIVLVSTANGLMGLLLSGSTSAPIIPRVIFGNVGFARSNAFCSVYDQIYGMSSEAGAVRTNGGSENPDSTFSFPVQRYFKRNGFTSASTVVVFDQLHDAVIFASGRRAVPYMRASGRWSTPIVLPSSISGSFTAGIAYNGMAALQVGGNVYSLDTAGGGDSWFIRSPCADMGMGLNMKTTTEYHAAADSACVFDLMVPNAAWTTFTSIGGLFPYTLSPPFGALGSRCLKPNRDFRIVSQRISGPTGNMSPFLAQLNGFGQPMGV